MTPMLAHGPRTDRAFERIYRHHVRAVYRYALAVLRSPEDAEDVTQTAFLNAYRIFDRGDPVPDPDQWLLSIAHELCQQRARQEEQLSEIALEDEALVAVPEEEEPTGADVHRALRRLPFDQRAALIMREVEERPYAQIAELLSLSRSAVETLVFEARRALREALEGALTCHEAERAISRNLDGLLSRAERGQLRSHLRECPECVRFAKDQGTKRVALRALANVRLPSSLASFKPPVRGTA